MASSNSDDPSWYDSAKIVITEADLPIEQPTVLRLTADDLPVVVEPAILTVGLNDVVLVDRLMDSQTVRLTAKEIPPIPEIIRIRAADIPEDLNNVTTECYHGTSWDVAKRIEREGFKVGRGMAYGAGIYFSVGAVGVANSFAKGSRPCIIRARVSWGRVAYLDDPKLPASIKSGGGEARTRAALRAGYDSLITTKKFSGKSPAYGIVLGTLGSYIRSPHIQVIELIDPRKIK